MIRFSQQTDYRPYFSSDLLEENEKILLNAEFKNDGILRTFEFYANNTGNLTMCVMSLRTNFTNYQSSFDQIVSDGKGELDQNLSGCLYYEIEYSGIHKIDFNPGIKVKFFKYF